MTKDDVNFFMEFTFQLVPDAYVLAAAVLVALAIDIMFGEPSTRFHPVVAIGRYLEFVGHFVSRDKDQAPRPRIEFCLGVLGWSIGASVVVGVAVVVVMTSELAPPILQIFIFGVLLKPLLSWRMLKDEVLAVELALGSSIQAGRIRIGMLVSRDVSKLSETEVREAAISTLGENLNDSVIAPLFWFAIAGLPGAALYRFANTADAMWGYLGCRNGRDWTWGGKFAARVDDVLSWLPARLSALFIALPVLHRNWSKVVANARCTPSPNSGWPMGALAFSLGIRLSKPGIYELNAFGRTPVTADTVKALRRCGQVMCFITVLAAVVAGVGVLI